MEPERAEDAEFPDPPWLWSPWLCLWPLTGGGQIATTLAARRPRPRR